MAGKNQHPDDAPYRPWGPWHPDHPDYGPGVLHLLVEILD